MKILTAKYVLPVTSDPIANGAVAVERDKIVAVGEKMAILRRFPDAEIADLSNSVILPGLVNCHSHLELTIMRGFLDRFDSDFFKWLITLTNVRRDRLTPEDIEISAQLGALEGAASGTTTFADIGRTGRAGLNALKKAGLRGIVFQETEFSPENRTAESDFKSLKENFLELRSDESELVRAGLSSHAPYTVSPKLFELIAKFASDNKVKTSIHASESDQEEIFMKTGKGFFREIFQKNQIEWSASGVSAVKFLEQTGALAAQPLLAHCTKVSSEDLEVISKTGSKIAHCPKSNAKFGHGVAPLQLFLKNGIRTGLGTDSMGSNNSCDLIEEARFASLSARSRYQTFLENREMIELCTIGGARALGLEEEIGSLEPGKQADLIALSLDHPSMQPVNEIHASLIFGASSRDVLLTMVAGKVVYENGRSTTVDQKELSEKIGIAAAKMV
ncbi:MAG: amidohydrolase family protein [Pyrinomonadaceae bacterium]|nr:amidohydrolase family protein [Pyrinomonadaceae bacterium]